MSDTHKNYDLTVNLKSLLVACRGRAALYNQQEFWVNQVFLII